MFGKKDTEKRLTIEEYLHFFALRNSHSYESKTRFVTDNIRFTIERGYGDFTITIHLVDSEDELLVYTAKINGGSPKGSWIHKGVWCERIEQVLREDYEQKKRKEMLVEQAKTNEEIRLKDKFGGLFSGYSNV